MPYHYIELLNLFNETTDLKTSLNDFGNYTVSDIAKKIGKYGTHDVYRVSYDVTLSNDDVEKQIPVPFNGGQVLKINGIAYYDSSTACVPLGQYNENFKIICGITTTKKMYFIQHSGDRINLVRVYIDYFI